MRSTPSRCAGIFRARAKYNRSRSRLSFPPSEWSGGIDYFAADHGEQRFGTADLVHRNGHVVFRQDGEIGELASFERASRVLVVREPGAAHGVEAQGLGTAGRLLGSAERLTPHRFAILKPLERGERIIRCHAMSVRPGSDHYTQLFRGLDRRHTARGLRPILFYEILTAEIHFILHGPSHTQRLHAAQTLG